MKIAIFPGTFDPFTVGHADIVRRALPLFDQIIIAIGQNQDKQPLFPLDKRLQKIRDYYQGEQKIQVVSYDGLTAEYASEQGVQFILRGVRCVQDFEYERNIAEANKEISGIETILLYTSPQYAHISSSFVRDLYKHNYDISKYVI